ncbi:MAG: 2-oxoglutarate dehydrogenase, E2 component, dihydrolipoamide succinyltransferase [Vicinamibacterales bacterium]
MPTNVVMPQMGESITEGTIVRWMKQVGDKVDRDEPLFEISTDKVDAEIPSPAAGILTEIRAKAGETVAVDSVVAVLGEAGAAPAKPAAAAGKPQPAPSDSPAPVPSSRFPQAPAAAEPRAAEASAAEEEGEMEPAEEAGRRRNSPLVRRIAREHGVDLSQVPGSGIGGRVTKQDILDFIRSREEEVAEAEEAPPVPTPAPAPAHAGPPAFRPGERVEVVPMSIMRRRIAEHMIASRRTSAHVHSVFEVDFANVAAIRSARKEEYEKLGVKLTFLPFIVKAVADGLRAVPVVNASVDGENIVYKKDVNVGIAVALDWGLIVPVVKQADEKNILGLARAINDLGDRARRKQLKPDEVQGGTFTITNPGVFGALFGMPIINQPQVAILGVGAIEKRPVVVDDMIAIRARAYLSLGYDHRLIDGAVADEFMSIVKEKIETFDPASL